MTPYSVRSVTLVVILVCTITGSVIGRVVVAPRRSRGERYAGPMTLAVTLCAVGIIAAVVNLVAGWNS